MLVLTTGATGLLGFHVARMLLDEGHEVRVLARDPEKARRLFAGRVTTPTIAAGDMTDRAAVERALDGCDGVVHCAALVGLKREHARQVAAGNMSGVRNVVGGALERGIQRLVYVSSIGALLSPKVRHVDSDSPVGISSGPYSQSKLEGEVFARRLQAQGAPIHISYPSAILGPDDPGCGEANKALANMVRSGVLVTASGLQFVDVRDLAVAHVRLLQSSAPGGRYMLSGHFLPWGELASALEKVTGRQVRRIRMPGAVLRWQARFADVIAALSSRQLPLTAELATLMTQWPTTDSASSLSRLGLTFRPPLETLRETLHWLRIAGHLQRSRARAVAQHA